MAGAYAMAIRAKPAARRRQRGEKRRVSQMANAVPRTRLKNPTRRKSPTARMKKTSDRRAAEA